MIYGVRSQYKVNCKCSTLATFLLRRKSQMGKKAFYKVGIITRAENDLFNTMVKQILTKRAAQISAYEKYIEFCTLNSLVHTHAATILQYCACQKFNGMDPGSILTMEKYIFSEERRRRAHLGITRGLVVGLFKLAKTKVGTKHAVDADFDLLIAALSAAPACHERTQLCLMLLIGSRNKDISGYGALRFSKNATIWTVLCDVVISKTRNSPDDKCLLTLRGITCTFGKFPANLQLAMMNWKGEYFVKTATVLTFMKKANTLAKYTTYTFRRNYIHRIITVFSNRDGSADWKSILQFTLHFSEKTVKSVYAKTAAEIAGDLSTSDTDDEQDSD